MPVRGLRLEPQRATWPKPVVGNSRSQLRPTIAQTLITYEARFGGRCALSSPPTLETRLLLILRILLIN